MLHPRWAKLNEWPQHSPKRPPLEGIKNLLKIKMVPKPFVYKGLGHMNKTIVISGALQRVPFGTILGTLVELIPSYAPSSVG